MVLATKGRFPMGDGPNDVGLSRRHLARALDASLRRLGVEHIDLYQVHAYDPVTPLEETLRFLDDAVRAGKIRYVGLSNFTGWQLQRAVDLAEFRGLAGPVTLQPQYNLLVREIEWEIVPACEANGLGPAALVAAGRRVADRQVPARRAADRRDPARARTRARRRGLRPPRPLRAHVGRDRGGPGRRRGRGACRWPRSRWPGWPTGRRSRSVILGARTLEQLEDNLGAAGLHLTTEETERLDAASDPAPADYPYGGPGDRAAQPSLSRRGPAWTDVRQAPGAGADLAGNV